QSTTILALARTPGRLFVGCQEDLIPDQSIYAVLIMILTLTAGTGMIMWFGELITDRGIGNGMSLLIFASIISAIPSQLYSIQVGHGTWPLVITCIVGLAIIVAIVFVEQAQRRIPVQYAKRMIGSRMYGGASTYIPLKVNMAGVIPVIFASSLIYIPQLIVSMTGSESDWARWVAQNFTVGNEPPYLITYAALIIFFTYFYVSITFNPVDVADNMKKYGGFIPGIRAGRPTAEYLDYVLTRLTFPGSIYLTIVAVLPFVAFASLGVQQDFLFGGTSILIMVGVGLDTVKQLQSQLQQRNYEGFLR
ncbi:MAG: preprotein translocase subunit SecY, partial [Candidatus Nanopelagicales bacterium]|nr:preprotein translocase subunit SecY [Candidatus Nanopelagicales bacterium]